MSEETTNPEQSPVVSILGRRSRRLALLALAISFGLNVSLWGSLIYWVGITANLSMAVGACVVFIAFMAGAHWIGYCLWSQQFVQDQGHGNVLLARPISPAFRPAIKFALLQQGIVLILALLVMDMGETMCTAVTAIMAYWLAFGIIVDRRPNSPTRGDLFLLRCGFLLMFCSGMAVLPFFAKALGLW